jgi:hypothetical protein
MTKLALSTEFLLDNNKEFVKSCFDEFKKDSSLVKNPMSQLAFMKGFTPEKLLAKFIPLIATEKDVKEAASYADIGIDILEFLDKNMWRTELPEAYFFVFDKITDVIDDLYSSGDKWLKRKAMKMHMRISDVQADKRRFIEYVITEDRLKALSEAKQKQKELEAEIIDV